MEDYKSPYKIRGINFKFNNDPLKLKQPKNLHINLLQEKEPWSPSQGMLDFAGGLKAVTGGLSLLGDINKMNQGLKQQREYFQDVFNTNNVTAQKKTGTWNWLNSTGQNVNEYGNTIIPFEAGASGGVNANTIMYPGNNMLKRKYGGSLFLTMAEGGQTPMAQPGALPKLELGAMSPVQKLLSADNKHYGIPVAKNGGFFTPDKLSAGAENDEFYNKPQDDMMVAKKMAQDYIYKKGTTGESIPDINAPQMAMGGNPFNSFGSANDTFGGSGDQFGQYNNPLNDYYSGLYNKDEHNHLVQQFPETMTNMFRSVVSPIAANVRAKDQALIDQLQNLDNLEQQQYGGMRKYQTTGAITPPTATDAAGFENWYNTTLGSMMGKSTPEQINAFINQARQWAYDNKIDPNQLGQSNLNTNTVQGSMDPAYEADLDKTIADFESKYALAAAQGASQADLDAILAEQDAAVKGVIGGQSIDASGNMTGGWSGKYNPKVNNVPADYFGYPNAAQPGTTPGTGGGGRGGYGYSPYVTDVLQAMANGYTRVPLLGFRSRRGLNNVLREAMAQRMLGESGQGNWQGGNGTLNSAGAQGGWQGGVYMNPGVTPGGGSGSNSTYDTWMEDNNIKRYRSDADPVTGRYSLDVKRYNPNGISFGGRGRNGEDDGSEGLFERLRERRRDRKEYGDMTPMTGKDASPLPNQAPGLPTVLLPNNRGFLEGIQQEIDYRNTPNAYSPMMPRDAQPDDSDMIYPPMMPGYGAPESLIGNPYVPGAGGRGRIMTDSPYTGQQIDVNAANRLMAGDRARKIQREWNRKEMGKMGNSPEETGEYGPMNPDTRQYAPQQQKIVNQNKRRKRFQEEIRNIGNTTGEEGIIIPKEYGGQYKEGGTYYLSGGQIAKLRALGYDVQEH